MREQDENQEAAAFAASLGIKPQTDLSTGEACYDLHELAAALGISAEELFEQLADEEGCVVLVDERDLERAQ
ncbi:MAG: hypothetical protein ACYDD1_14915 [Caulobacteraceae bacterium]